MSWVAISAIRACNERIKVRKMLRDMDRKGIICPSCNGHGWYYDPSIEEQNKVECDHPDCKYVGADHE